MVITAPMVPISASDIGVAVAGVTARGNKMPLMRFIASICTASTAGLMPCISNRNTRAGRGFSCNREK